MKSNLSEVTNAVGLPICIIRIEIKNSSLLKFPLRSRKVCAIHRHSPYCVPAPCLTDHITGCTATLCQERKDVWRSQPGKGLKLPKGYCSGYSGTQVIIGQRTKEGQFKLAELRRKTFGGRAAVAPADAGSQLLKQPKIVTRPRGGGVPRRRVHRPRIIPHRWQQIEPSVALERQANGAKLTRGLRRLRHPAAPHGPPPQSRPATARAIGTIAAPPHASRRDCHDRSSERVSDVSR